MRSVTKRFSVLIIGCVLLGGCAGGHQARSVDLKPDSILVDRDIYQKGADGQALHRYTDKSVDMKAYSKIIIDPVLIYKEAELDKDELENYQKLANNAFVYLNKEISTQLTVVKEPEPGTLRIQMAIIDAKKSAPVRTVLSSTTPIGAGLSLLKFVATGKQSGVGEITAELRATDAMTGRLIAAGYDRRVGNKQFANIYDFWANANQALEYWAKQSAWLICDTKGGTNCVKP